MNSSPGWHVEGVILAAMLPSKPIEVLGCTIAPLGEPTQLPSQLEGVLKFVPAPGATNIGQIETSPSPIKLTAFHSITTDVLVMHSDTAVQEARRRFACVAATLSMATPPSRPAIVEIVRSRELNEGEAPWQLEGGATSFSAVAVADLTQDVHQRLGRLADLASASEQLQNILRLWYEAHDYELHSFSEVGNEHILLRFGKVLEALADLVAPQPSEDPEWPDDVDGVLSDLSQVLAGTRERGRKANFVINAGKKLQAIQFATIGSRIRATCAKLSLDGDQTDIVMQAWSARSKEGGHPGEGAISAGDINGARDAANLLLATYLQSVS